MANTQVSSLSDADTRLAELNTEILRLETERSELLRGELARADARVEEIQSFIGVYLSSSKLGGGSTAAAPKKKRAAKKKASGKRRGRPPGKKAGAKRRGRPPKSDSAKPAPKKRAAKKKASGRRPRGNNAERLGTIKDLVKKAGKDGVSARKIAKETNFPYVSVLNILNDGGNFKKQGEKRDRRYFLK